MNQVFALDFDGTITEAPQLWSYFIRIARQLGNEVHIVTMRHEHELFDVYDFLKRNDLKVASVVATGRRAKRNFVQALNLSVDVWIDDKPHWVHNDHTEITGLPNVWE